MEWEEKLEKNQTNKRPNNVERTSGRQFFMMSENESLLFIFSWKKKWFVKNV